MKSHQYDPKELLCALFEIEERLEEAIVKYCPESELSVETDLEQAMHHFLNRHDVKGNEVGFLSTQMAMQHLRSEVEKAKGIVVDTNSLRAWKDFKQFQEERYPQRNHKQVNGPYYTTEKFRYLILGAAIIGVITTCYFFIFTN